MNQQVKFQHMAPLMSLHDKETNAKILTSIDSKFQVGYESKLRKLISSKKCYIFEKKNS